ncbi:MAG TPA: hypothetical protein VE623_14360 [Acidimicrobiales bacterium]|nr:hypothetical protein [Acidimicrobiales bacterium]
MAVVYIRDVTALDTVDRLAGYYPSLFPAECGGPRRQKALHGRGLGILDGESLDLTLRDTERWNVMFLWRDPGELYLHSTSPVAATHPIGLVERVDPLTLDPLATTEPLPTGGHIWCGAMVVHENGDLYVVNGRYLHRLRFDLTLAAEAELPSDGAHNTLLVGADGNLIVKDNRIGGVPCVLELVAKGRTPVGQSGGRQVMLELGGIGEDVDSDHGEVVGEGVLHCPLDRSLAGG